MERYRYEDDQSNVGVIGWMALGAGVLAWDLYASESLTHAFRRGLDSSRYRPILLAGMAVTALHLLDKLPPAGDPFVLAEKIGKAGLEVYRSVH